MREGWICPNCKRGVSPDQQHCDCRSALSPFQILRDQYPNHPNQPSPFTPNHWKPVTAMTGGVGIAPAAFQGTFN